MQSWMWPVMVEEGWQNGYECMYMYIDLYACISPLIVYTYKSYNIFQVEPFLSINTMPPEKSVVSEMSFAASNAGINNNEIYHWMCVRYVHSPLSLQIYFYLFIHIHGPQLYSLFPSQRLARMFIQYLACLVDHVGWKLLSSSFIMQSQTQR